MAIRLCENFRALFYAPFYAAQAIGAYAAEGVDVTMLPSPDPLRTVAALREGEADVMWGGPLRVMLTHAAEPEADTVCFCDVVTRDPFFVIGREARPNFDFADLTKVRFASVAEVPTPWLCLQDDLRRAGIDPQQIDRISGPSMADNAAALRGGALDAVQVFQPYAEKLIASGAGHLWYAQASRGRTAYTTFVTRRSVLTSRHEELERMTRAMARTLQWIAATDGDEIARTLGGYLPDVPHALLAAAIDRYRALGVFATEPLVTREGFERLQGAMRSGGALDHAIPFERCVDNSLAGFSA